MSARVIHEEVVRASCEDCGYLGEWTYEDSEAEADAEQHNRLNHHTHREANE